PGRRMQRLRLLRRRVPLRRDRTTEGPGGHTERGHRPEVHAVLRPARRRHGAGVREGVSDRLDPVRRRRGTARSGRAAPGGGTGERRGPRAVVRPRPGRRRRRCRGVLPIAGRTGGLRAATGPGGDHPGPACHVQSCRAGRPGAARRCRRGVPRRAAVSARHAASPGRRDEGRAQPAGGGDGEYTTYYGRPVVKAPPWEVDIPAYMFAGGLAAGSSLLAAGGDLTGRPALRRAGRLTAAGALGFSMVALIHDLGRPGRFLNMLRTMKLTSPMS